jgi:hypothetical protein
MTWTEILGLLLAIVGIVFAFERPRRWFVRVTRLPRATGNASHDRGDTRGGLANPPNNPVSSAVSAQPSPITVEEIVETINRAPPFQREELSRKYSGIGVEWTGYLRDIHEDFRDKQSVRVNLYVDKSRPSAYSFWFTQKVATLPDIRTLTQHSEIRVKGKILSASGPGMCVDLEPNEIYVVDRAT